MAEERWTLDTPDGFKIHGVLNKPDKKKNDKAIIHVHGLGGSERDYAAVRLAMTFPKLGYDIIRPNLYYWKDSARSLVDCSIKIHASDINTLIKYFKQKYKKLYATGHSYGGPSLLTSNINQFNAVSLWDPTYLPEESFDYKDFIKAGKYYISPTGSTLVLSKEFIDESKKYNRKKSIALAKKCTAPLQVVYAEYWTKEGESFHTYSKGATDEKTIKQSLHAFYEEGTTEKLLRYTRKWFDQF